MARMAPAIGPTGWSSLLRTIARRHGQRGRYNQFFGLRGGFGGDGGATATATATGPLPPHRASSPPPPPTPLASRPELLLRTHFSSASPPPPLRGAEGSAAAPCSSSATFGVETEGDPYGHLRRPEEYRDPTPPLRSRLRVESRRTVDRIDAAIGKDGPEFRRRVRWEMERAAAVLIEAQSGVSEVGPAGLHEYRTEDCRVTGRRTFWRRRRRRQEADGSEGSVASMGLAGQDDDDDGERDDEELVLRVDDPTALLGPMSLSRDESCLAYLRRGAGDDEDDDGASSVILAVRHIPSGEEFVLPHDGGVRGRMYNVEFGGRGVGYGVEGDDEHHYLSDQHHHALFFTTTNALHRPSSAYRCVFHCGGGGASFSDPELILRDDDEANFVDVTRTKGGRFVAINSTSKTSNEVHLVAGCTDGPMLVRRREDGVRYFVDCGSGDEDGVGLILVANRMAATAATSGASTSVGIDDDDDYEIGQELSVFETSVSQLPLTGRSFGCKIVPPQDGAFIEEIDLFEKYLVLYERSKVDGTQQIRVVPRRRGLGSCRGGDDDGDGGTVGGDAAFLVPLPSDVGGGPCSCISPGGNAWYRSTVLRFSISSPLLPSATFEYDMDLGGRAEAGAARRVGNHDEEGAAVLGLDVDDYEQRRVLVESCDGTLVPMSMVYSKEAEDDARPDPVGGRPDPTAQQRQRPRPTLILGYGAYGVCQDLRFDPSLVPLLTRGWTVAFAHTRGGGELGPSWYEAGRARNKGRAVEDLVACAEALVAGHDENGRDGGVVVGGGLGGGVGVGTTPDLLAAMGVSAGGVVVAASAVNRRPDLFGAGVVLEAPFLDVSGAMSDPSLPLTAHEWDEWGDPIGDEEARRCIEGYCPFFNIESMPSGVRHPPPRILLIGAVDDDAVPVWHPVTFAAKIRDSCAANEDVSHRPGGKGGESGSPRPEEDTSCKVKDAGGIFLLVEDKGGHHFEHSRFHVSSLEVAFLQGSIVSKTKKWDTPFKDSQTQSFLSYLKYSFW